MIATQSVIRFRSNLGSLSQFCKLVGDLGVALTLAGLNPSDRTSSDAQQWHILFGHRGNEVLQDKQQFYHRFQTLHR